MSALIGINLSAQTGCSVQTKIDFAMNAAGTPGAASRTTPAAARS